MEKMRGLIRDDGKRREKLERERKRKYDRKEKKMIVS